MNLQRLAATPGSDVGNDTTKPRGLLDCDKLTVATMLAFRILVLTKQIRKEEVDILVRAPPDPNPKAMPESLERGFRRPLGPSSSP